jgi:hypothetical protein
MASVKAVKPAGPAGQAEEPAIKLSESAKKPYLLQRLASRRLSRSLGSPRRRYKLSAQSHPF